MTDAELITKWKKRLCSKDQLDNFFTVDQDLEDNWARSRKDGFFTADELSPYELWKKFYNSYQEGDDIWYYNSSTNSWKESMGTQGYAIFRNNEYICNYTTMQS